MASGATRSDAAKAGRAALRLGAAGLAALALGFGSSPATLAINAYWFLLLLAIALLGGLAWYRLKAGIIAAEAVTTLIILHGLWPVFSPNAPLVEPRGTETNGSSWRLVFTSLDQAVAKDLPLPPGWQEIPLSLRVDLGTDYKGQAGFLVQINGQTLGELKNGPQNPGYSGEGTARWLMPVPHDVLALAPIAHVVLRPTSLDPTLSIAGSADPLADPLKEWGSWFFDGREWRNDRLAGPSRGRAAGTYRIWLVPSQGEVPVG